MTGELGWSFVRMREGVVLNSLHEGWMDREESKPWTHQTLVPVWSATKGPMAATLLMALHQVGMDSESFVHRVWPELQVGNLTFGELLSHQGGLAGLDQTVSIWDREEVVWALEQQPPLWSPGHHGYHPRTIGFLADEILRKMIGCSLGDYWFENIAKPNGIEFWIGLPKNEHHRVAELVPARLGEGGEPKAFYEALLSKETLTRRAFSSPGGLSGVSEMNQAKAWEAGFPAMGGVGSALGLATFYQWVLRQDFLGELIAARVSGFDEIQRIENSFGFGMMLGLGPRQDCFGHPGAGGSYGMANAKTGESYAFVMNRFEANLYPSKQRLDLITQLAQTNRE